MEFRRAGRWPAAIAPGLDPRNSRASAAGIRRASSGLSSARLAVRVISALLSASLMIYIGVLWSEVHGIDDNVTQVPVAILDGPDNTTDPNKANYDGDGADRNLLIVGNDDRAGMTAAEIKLLKTGGNEGSLSTDTMMIVHVPADGSKATLISLPRDSYVAIPGYGMNRLNAAYSDGYIHQSGSRVAKIGAGADLLIRTIYQLTSLHIDNFVQVGLVGFYRIAQAIGGIPVNLCNTVDDTHAYNVAHGQDGGSGFKMSKGHHLLTPVQALEFVRQRHHFPLGDLQRVDRQRYFLTAAFRQVASAGMLLNPSKLGDLVDAVDRSLYVGGKLKLLDLAKQMSNLSADKITGTTIPYVRFATVAGVGAVNIVDPARVKSFVRSIIDGTSSSSSAYTSAKLVEPATVAVTVYNAGSRNGAASAASRTLKKAGFRATYSTDSPAVHGSTTIQYPKGMESEAKTLARYVPGARVSPSDVSTVTLTLGADNRTARSKPTVVAKSARKKAKAIDSVCIA